VVHFGHFLTLDPKCTGTFWASSTERLTFDPKCTGTFWAVSTGLWLLKCTGTFWMVSMGLQLTWFTFDPKCTGTFWTVSLFDRKCTGAFWAVSAERLTFDPKCTGTFWAVLTDFSGICGCSRCSLEKCTGTFLAVSTFECSPTFIYCGGVEEGGGRRGTAVPFHVPPPNHAGRKNDFFFFRSLPSQNSMVTWFWSRETDNIIL
jgi:hypothetical protein